MDEQTAKYSFVYFLGDHGITKLSHDFFGILVIKCILSLGRFSKSPAVYGLGDIKTLISLRVMVLLITLHHTRSNESTKEV